MKTVPLLVILLFILEVQPCETAPQAIMSLQGLAIEFVLSTVIYRNFSHISQHLEKPFESAVLKWH